MYKQRDILLIPIPFTDLTTQRRRPVLVVSNNDYNDKTEDIIVVAMTANLVSKDYALLVSSTDLEEGTLSQPSMIRTDRIYTLNKGIVIRKFGVLNVEVFRCVTDLLQDLFSSQ
ncbi:MAG: type II toxin-antitoxin system PemK/MazF family toxin [Candidatus Poribacteria bacterium]